MEMIERYSADAVRYWAASTGTGKDAIISEEKIQLGARLVNKLWNVARFSERFLLDGRPAGEIPPLSGADAWILSRTQTVVERVTVYLHGSDYAAAKSEIEGYFWTELADNYLEMAKLRLYDESHPGRAGALYALYHALLATLKLLALFLPHVTERIYLQLYAEREAQPSIHVSPWPVPDPRLRDPAWEQAGEALVAIATAARRFKSEQGLPLSTELAHLQVAATEPALCEKLRASTADLASITRAGEISFGNAELDTEPGVIQLQDGLQARISL